MGKWHTGSSDSEVWFGLNSANCTNLDIQVVSRRNYSGALSLNKWYHVVGTYDGGPTRASLKVYLNGVRVDDTNEGAGTFTSMANTTAHFVIGASDLPNFPFAGRMDDVRVYNRALSADEIKQLYNMGQ